MTTLYRIATEYRQALAELSQQVESGELDEAIMQDTLEGLGGELEDKLLACAKYARELEADNEARKQRIAELKDAAERDAKKAARLMDFVCCIMQETNKLKVSDIELTLNVRKSESVEIINPELIPDYLLRTVPESKEPDKKLIKEYLKILGCDLPFAKIKTNFSLVAK